MSTTSAQIIEAEIAAISAAIDQAAGTVEQGNQVDLAMLGARVEGLCAALLTLPAVDARRIGAALPTMVDILDKIARTLVDRGAGAGSNTSDSPTSHGQAAQAYGATLSRARR